MTKQDTKDHVFITGATGCVGHYLIRDCLTNPKLHIHVLVRNPEKLKFSEADLKRITIHLGDFKQIEAHAAIIAKMDYIIHSVTEWWGSEQTMQVNVDKTKAFFMMADQDRLKQIIYFSTASILGKGNKVIDEATLYGSDYIKSKYHAYHMIKALSFSNKITIMFPTMVFGGDTTLPQSHITKGVYGALRYLKYIRYIYVDGAFHFMHAADIATTCVYLMQNPTEQRNYVLGNKEINVKDTLCILYTLFNMKPWFRIHVKHKFLYFLAWLFRIKIGLWEKYCMENSYMIFDTVTPKTFGLENKFENLETIITDIQTF
ncbi:hypothetical protein DID74_00860 [Candidatus Marinamargulisbacteria bacterium SCGC AG-333-B06]|nr:hypothetical protein DID74_00860 [Candidatus Marinamargulisbacteria bacterium SCGC AG-333-B06]